MAMPPDGPVGAFPPHPPDLDDPWPSSGAEIFIYLDSDDAADRPSNRMFSWLRRFGSTKMRMRLAVPDAEADQMLRTLERMVLAVMWPFAVVGTLFGAGSAHLPPTCTTIVVVLEILVPPLLFRGRRSLAGHRFGCGLRAMRPNLARPTVSSRSPVLTKIRHRTESAGGTYQVKTAGLAATTVRTRARALGRTEDNEQTTALKHYITHTCDVGLMPVSLTEQQLSSASRWLGFTTQSPCRTTSRW